MGKGKGVTSYNDPEGASSATGEAAKVVTTKAKAAPRTKPAKAKKR